MAIHSPINAESLFGLSAILLLLVRAKTLADARGTETRWSVLALAAITVIVAGAFWRAASFYFLSDDFLLLKYAQATAYRTLFTTAGGDGFYRPLTYASMALTATWAGLNPVYWHVTGFVLHAANSMLLYSLACTLRLSRYAAWFAAALFAVHGTRPEAVVWIAGRHDLLATFFVLLGLACFVHAADLGGGRAVLYRSVALLAMILAFLSKESAYTFPLLLVVVVVLARKRRAYFTLIPFFAVAAGFMAWRWILFGGAGGYLNPAGQPEILSLSIVPILKALALRLWAVLFFPINWSNQPGLLLGGIMVLYLAALLWLSRTEAPTRSLLIPLGFLMLLALPPLQQLLIGPDLQKARLLYLPSVGFCLLLATMVEHLKAQPRWATSMCILVFNLGALFHNLNAWEYASQKAKAACVVAAACPRGPDGKVAVTGLPRSLQGVYFFANGFEECVDMQRKADLPLDAAQPPCQLSWDAGNDTLR
jgi:hypothetical protein